MPDMYQSCEVLLTVGDSAWNSEDRDEDSLPHCKVGEWDSGNFEDSKKELASLWLQETADQTDGLQVCVLEWVRCMSGALSPSVVYRNSSGRERRQLT